MPIYFKEYSVESTPQSPFEGDRLNRAELVRSLYTFTNKLSETGCVFAINGDWGSGKTTIIKMWRNFIEQNGGKSLYFNAWESDFEEDPLIALMGELKNIFPDSSNFKNLLEKGGRVAAKVGGALTKGLIKKYLGINTDTISEAISDGVDEAVSICINSINAYEESKAEFEGFKKALIEFIASESTNSPIIFFIDELDRCNPRFAIKILERVKHLFEVPNIVFVISVNLNQLQYAVQGFYGSSKIDGREYLRRFIDLEYVLPEPDIENYVRVLIDNHDFSSFFNQKKNYYPNNRKNDAEIFTYLAVDLLSKSNLNLRVINKIMAYFRLVLFNFSHNTNIAFDLLFLLCFIKILHPELYKKIKNYEFTLQGLLDSIETTLSPALFGNEEFAYTSRHMAFALASLLFAYNFKTRGIETEKDFKLSYDTELKNVNLPISPSILDKNILFEALYYINQSDIHMLGEGLGTYFNKIDFVNGMRF